MKTRLISMLVLALACQAFAARKASDAPFLKPEEAVAKMTYPDNFEVKVFAADPDIGEPIAFCIDDRGRVWTVENYNYINRRSHHEKDARTIIRILEDTDGDGVFDEKKVFTDKLRFSSGIALGFGGVFVGAPPNFVFIPDADGDDVPDSEPEVLLDGWGIHDRHETLNSFIWGPDGWLYGCHGVFTRSEVGAPGTPKEKRQFIDGGIWRYHPTRKEFEVFAQGLSNPWGFDFNDHGQGFATCCVIPHLFHVIQGGVYHKQSRANVNRHVYNNIKTIRDHTHQSAHGGARFYLADVFPAEYRDRLFMCNIHQHQVLTDIMERKGSGYVGKHGDDFLSANDLAWVGFSVETGPEGAVYILDWHDTDICGNAINFPNSGRIYRILPKDAPSVPQPNIRALSDLELVHLQNHSNDWYVRQARVFLHSRSEAGKLDAKPVHSALKQMLKEAPNSGKRLRAMWALHVTQGLDALRMLDHEDEYVRAFAIQFLCEERKPPKEALDAFVEMAREDPSPVVRLYLASALQRIEHDPRWPILENLVQHAEDNSDHNIPRLVWLGMEKMVPLYPERSLQLVVKGKMPMLQEHVARRIVTGGKSAVPKKASRSGNWKKTIQRVASGFEIKDVGTDGVVFHTDFRNKSAVQTHPKDRNKACEIYRTVSIPEGKTTALKLRVSHHPHGDWQLRIKANGETLLEQLVGPKTVTDEWLALDVDLSKFAGSQVELVLENVANDWAWEFGYWNQIELVSH